MKLAAAIEEFLLSVTEESTRTVYHYTLRKLLAHFGDKDITEVTISELRRWLIEVGQPDPVTKKKLSVYTVHRDGRTCRQFFKWLVTEGHLDVSPAVRLALPKLPRGEPPKAISDIDLERMLDYATEHASARDYAVLRFLAETGGRVGGLVGLRLGDLDLENSEATVHEKGHKSRAVHFGEETIRALRAWLVVRPREKWGDVVFVGKRGPLTSSGVSRLLERMANEAGVEGRHNPHSFRHAFARRLLKHGADMGTVSQLLGHSDIETTHRFYARWTSQELARRHREFGGILDDETGRRAAEWLREQAEN